MAVVSSASCLRKAANDLRTFVETVQDSLLETEVAYVSLPPADDPWVDRGQREVAFGTKYMLWPPIVWIDGALREMGLRIRGKEPEPNRAGLWAETLAHHVEFAPQYAAIGPRVLRIGQMIFAQHERNARNVLVDGYVQRVEIHRTYVVFAERTALCLDEIAERISPLRTPGKSRHGISSMVKVRRGAAPGTVSFTQEELNATIRKYREDHRQLYAKCISEIGTPVALASARETFGRNAIARALRCASPPMVGRSPVWRAMALELDLPIKDNRAGRIRPRRDTPSPSTPSSVELAARENELRQRLAKMGPNGKALLEALNNRSQSLDQIEEIADTLSRAA